MRARIRSAVKIVGALAIGLVAAEFYLQLTMLPEHTFGTWFSAGIHQPDTKYGFVFRPHYQGWMRHTDGVWNVPLALDEHGLRLPAVEPGAGRQRVLILGGESMAMCYGLADAETLAARLAEHTQANCRVQTVSLAGLDLFRSWHLYLDKLADATEPPQLAVIAVYYLNEPAGYAWLPADLDEPPEPPKAADLFYFNSAQVINVPGRLAHLLGPNLFRSMLVYRAASTADHYLSKYFPLPASDPPIAPAPSAEIGGQRFAALLTRIDRHFAERGARTLVVFLPKCDEPADHFDRLEEYVPASIPQLNLHRRFASELGPRTMLAAGHYRASLADSISEAMAPAVDRILTENVRSAPSVADRKQQESATIIR